MKQIEEILEEIKEDKNDNTATTSFKFKTDLWNFFNKDEFKKISAIEFGTNKGQTTRVMSYLFNKVYTINFEAWRHDFAKQLNKDRTNIDYLVFDLYSSNQLYINDDNIEVIFIDAGHDYNHVVSDIGRAIQFKNIKYLVFDDYGLIAPVKTAVDEVLTMNPNTMSIAARIGHETGHTFVGNRNLKDSEGLIVKVSV
jgi:hypothetical protein